MQLCDRLTAGSEEGRTGLGKIHTCSRPGNACNIALTWLGRNSQSPSASHRALEEDTCGPRLGAPDSKQGIRAHTVVLVVEKAKTDQIIGTFIDLYQVFFSTFKN